MSDNTYGSSWYFEDGAGLSLTNPHDRTRSDYQIPESWSNQQAANAAEVLPSSAPSAQSMTWGWSSDTSTPYLPQTIHEHPQTSTLDNPMMVFAPPPAIAAMAPPSLMQYPNTAAQTSFLGLTEDQSYETRAFDPIGQYSRIPADSVALAIPVPNATPMTPTTRPRARSLTPRSQEMSHYGTRNADGTWSCRYTRCTSQCRFRRPCDLRKHYLRHLTRYYCSQRDCPESDGNGSGFSSRKDRTRHEQRHNPQVLCDWEDCPRIFSRRDNMTDHVRRIHMRPRPRRRATSTDRTRPA